MVSLQEAVEFISRLKQHKSEYEHVKQSIYSLYTFLFPLFTQLDVVEIFIKHIGDLIELAIENYEVSDIVSLYFTTAVEIHMQAGNGAEAARFSKKYLAYARSLANKDKVLLDALQVFIEFREDMSKVEYAVAVAEYMQLAEKLNTKYSPEYIDALFNSAYIDFSYGKDVIAYKKCLDGYEIAEQVYGSEINIKCTHLLGLMIQIKSMNKQFEESRALIEKLKGIEKKLTSIHSEQYKRIALLEQDLNEKEAKSTPKTRVWDALKPNTKTKLFAYLSVLVAVTAGAIYFVKKKDE